MISANFNHQYSLTLTMALATFTLPARALAEQATESRWRRPVACTSAYIATMSDGGTDSLNAAFQATWDVEDDIAQGESRASFGGGVLVGVGFYKTSNRVRAKLLSGPAAMFRFHWGPRLPHYLVDRSTQRLQRIENYMLPRLADQFAQTASGAVDELKRLDAKRAELEIRLQGEPSTASPALDQGADETMPPEETIQQTSEFRTAVRSELDAQAKVIQSRLSQACSDYDGTVRLREEVLQLIKSARAMGGTFGGFEGMIGYGFDVLSRPIDAGLEQAYKDDHEPMSGIVGGVGANLSLEGVSLSLGLLMHEQGLLGLYTGAGVPIFD